MEPIRSLLEPFKFLPPREVLTSACLVSTRWLSISRSEELWRELCILASYPSFGTHYSWLLTYKQSTLLGCCLPLVWSSSIALFNCRKESLSPPTTLSRQITVCEGSSVCFIPGFLVLVCGGGTVRESVRSVAIVSPHTGTVTTTKDMLVPRRTHGILPHGHSVYVFGGCRSLTVLSSTEAFHLPTKSWRKVGRMTTPRMGFQPCKVNTAVYLCGGNTTAVEVFNTVDESFTKLECSLAVAARACGFVYRSDLMVLNCVAVGKVSNGTVTNTDVEKQAYDSCGDCPAIVVYDKVYFPLARWSCVMKAEPVRDGWRWRVESLRIDVGK